VSDRTLLESLASERWFGARDKQAEDIKFLDRATISEGPPKVEIVLAAVEFGHKERRVYQLLLVVEKGETLDVGSTPSCLQPIGSLMTHGQSLAGKRGAFHFGGVGLNPLEPPGRKSVKALRAEQSNSSFIFDGRMIMKFFRRLEAGPNPDLELNRLLTGVGFEGVPTQVGEITYEGNLERRHVTIDLAIAQQYIGRGADGWVRTVRSVGELLKSSASNVSGRQRRESVEEASAQLLSELELLGDTTAGMHVALGRDDIPPELLAEPLKPADMTAWTRRAKAALARASRHPQFAPSIHEHASNVIDALRSIDDPGVKMRIHGDYHLGQVLFTRRGWIILDFEGEPLRTLEERRAKTSPLRDVAGLLRSLSYAASTALFESAAPDSEEWRRMEPWADTWETLARDRFLAGYRRRSHEGRFLPSDRSALAQMLSFFELDKALYEYIYETEHRPEWVRIPLRGIRTVLRRRRRR
jgi:maltose alpha-D-glucosyltransferase / alpha-amylase